MQNIKIGAASGNFIPGDLDHNYAVGMSIVKAAHADGQTFVALPELWLSGYECEDDFLRPEFQRQCLLYAHKFAEETRGMGMYFTIGIPLYHRGRLYNASLITVNAVVVGARLKTALAGDGNYYEPRQFKAWPIGHVEERKLFGKMVKIGDVIVELRSDDEQVEPIRVGEERCEEAWTENPPRDRLKRKNCLIIINSSASHYSRGKMATRKNIVGDGSRAFGGIYAFAPTHGCHGRLIFDGGAMIGVNGQLRGGIGKRFSFKKFQLVSTVVDLDLLRSARASTGSFYSDTEGGLDDVIVVEHFNVRDCKSASKQKLVVEEWEESKYLDHEEAVRGPALALFHWLQEGRLNGCMVSLSGGRDSALVACQVKYMVDLGVAELGMDGFKAELAHIPGINRCRNNRKLVRLLLTCAYQASKNSGDVTREAAEKLSDALGARYYFFNIAPIIALVLFTLSKVLKMDFNWKEHDIPLQNVQARIRAVIAWFMANIWKLLLICTSNRTEGGTGYWTAGGDGEGGLATVSGMSKLFICEVLWFIQNVGPQGFAPVPELEYVTKQEATAELQPPEMGQKDEDQLGPFPVLDQVETDAIENNRSPLECLESAQAEFRQYSIRQLAIWVDRWFTLWSRNQWKREQATAGLHVEAHNLDPRCGRRVAILSGGFRRELKEMWAHVDSLDPQPPAETKEKSLMTTEAASTNVVVPVVRALGIVDALNDFGSPTHSNGTGIFAALPVEGGEEVAAPTARLQRDGEYAYTFAGCDRHPFDMFNFASQNPGKTPYVDKVADRDGELAVVYPDHCKEFTWGASFLPGIRVELIDEVFPKGDARDKDSYSVCGNPNLVPRLKALGITDIDLTGLVFRICVGISAIDLVAAGFKVRVVVDATRDLPALTDFQWVIDKMKEVGVELITVDEVIAGA